MLLRSRCRAAQAGEAARPAAMAGAVPLIVAAKGLPEASRRATARRCPRGSRCSAASRRSTVRMAFTSGLPGSLPARARLAAMSGIRPESGLKILRRSSGPAGSRRSRAAACWPKGREQGGNDRDVGPARQVALTAQPRHAAVIRDGPAGMAAPRRDILRGGPLVGDTRASWARDNPSARRPIGAACLRPARGAASQARWSPPCSKASTRSANSAGSTGLRRSRNGPPRRVSAIADSTASPA